MECHSRQIPNEPMHNDTREYVHQQRDKQFISSKVLNEHKVVHIERYKCRACDKTYKHVSNMRRHEKTHVDEKYQCQFCEKAFTRKYNLNKHTEAKHCNDKNYKCIVCKKICKSQQNLHYYIDTNHLERQYKCNHCQSFTFRSNVRINIHTSEKSYLCEICGKAFRIKKDKNRHRSFVHSNTKLFKCLECDKSYKRKDSLYSHMRIKDHMSGALVEKLTATDNRRSNYKYNYNYNYNYS